MSSLSCHELCTEGKHQTTATKERHQICFAMTPDLEKVNAATNVGPLMDVKPTVARQRRRAPLDNIYMMMHREYRRYSQGTRQVNGFCRSCMPSVDPAYRRKGGFSLTKPTALAVSTGMARTTADSSAKKTRRCPFRPIESSLCPRRWGPDARNA